jgi:hypothetical protein
VYRNEQPPYKLLAKLSCKSVLQLLAAPLLKPAFLLALLPAPAQRVVIKPRDNACYKCSKLGYFSHNCPCARAKSKVVKAATLDNNEPKHEPKTTTNEELLGED